METMKQSGLWSCLGTHCSLVVIWRLCISSSGEARKFDFLSKIWPWRSMSISTQNNRDLNQCILHLWSKFGDPSLNGWWVMVQTSSKWGKFWLWPSIWPWRSRLIAPQNHRYLNQGVLHLWSKVGDPSLNGWWVIALTNLVTDGRTGATTIPGGQNWPRVKTKCTDWTFCLKY